MRGSIGVIAALSQAEFRWLRRRPASAAPRRAAAGSLCEPLESRTLLTVFTNANPIAVPGSGTVGPASPYPAEIFVSGMSGSITNVRVTLHSIAHTYLDDIDVLLVGPGGQSVVLMSDAGGPSSVSGRTLTFDDAAAGVIADEAAPSSGSYRPTNHEGVESYPFPAPAGAHGSTLSELDGTSPNGTWKLFVQDDASSDVGSFAGGWSLDITTTAAPTSISIPASGTSGNAAPYPSNVNLSGLSGTISDVTVTLAGVSHTYLDDIDILLVGPSGQSVVLMSDAGGGGPGVTNATYTFSDAAAFEFPDGTNPESGTYWPADYESGESYPFPAPSGPHGTLLSAFDGTDPNGTWSLYVVDDAGGDVGSIAGWTVNVTTSAGPAPDSFEPNDSFAAATQLGTLGDRTENGLTIHAPDNDDFFALTAANTGTLNVDLSFTHSVGDVDFAVYDDTQTLIGLSAGTSDTEHVQVSVNAGQTYYIRVIGYSGATNTYHMVIDGPAAAATPPWLAPGSAATWNSAAGTLTVSGAATIIADPGVDEPFILADGAAAVLTVDPTSDTRVNLGGMALSDGASVRVTDAGAARVLVVHGFGLDVGPTSALDMTDNDLIVDYAPADPSPEFALRDLVLRARDVGDYGIFFAGSDDDNSDRILAFGEASELGITEFDGVTVDGTTVVGKFTYYGDANLDGQVTTDDYVAVDLGLGAGDSWVQGDVDLNGSVTTDDYVVVDLNLGKGATTPLASEKTPPETNVGVIEVTTVKKPKRGKALSLRRG